MKQILKHLGIIISILILLLSCKSQKSSVEYKYINKTDTLIKTQINTIYKGITDTITIDNPCDSTGIINSFYSKLVIPNGTITIRSDRGNGKLKAFVKINDAISDIRSEAKSKTSESLNTITKEVIKYHVPGWILVLLAFESAIIVAYIWWKLN